MRAKNEIDHIFSELYSVPNCLQKPYFKLKVQELLLFLCMPLVICTPILIRQSAARRKKKKSRRRADIFSYAYHNFGGFDFQSRRFFLPVQRPLTM